MLTGFFVTLAAGLMAGCAAEGPRDLPVSLELPLAGSQISGEFSIGGKKVPLPKGVWTLIGTQIDKDGARGFRTLNMLARIEDGQLLSAVEVNTNIPIPKSAGDGKPVKIGEGWPSRRGCTRDDMHFLKVNVNVRLGEQDCWWVNHWRMHRSGAGASEHWKESVAYFTENKIAAPLDMIGVTYRLANKEDYLTINYFLSPESSGFEARNDVHWSITSWATSAWHPEEVRKDPKKTKYINEVIAWGESWHAKIKGSLEQY